MSRLRATRTGAGDEIPASQRAQLARLEQLEAERRRGAVVTVCGMATDAADAATLLDALGLDAAIDGPPRRRRRGGRSKRTT